MAAAAASQFESDWVAAGGKPASARVDTCRRWRRGSAADAFGEAQFLPSGPDQSEDTVHALLIDACFHARERMLAITPYFVPDVSLETAMRLAARRGVTDRFVHPGDASNHRLADFARNRALRSLSQAGVQVHLLPYMSHAKAVVFDDTLGACRFGESRLAQPVAQL